MASRSPAPATSSSRQTRHSPLPPQSDTRRRRPAASTAPHPPNPPTPDVPPSAGRFHYSLPPLPTMHPNYPPPHHSPYIPPQHYPHHIPPAHVGTNGGPIPAIYPYGLHHPPPYPHPYPPYPQYGPLAGPGGFPPPRPPDAPQASPTSAHNADTAAAAAAAAKGPKRKRKSEGNKSEDDADHPATATPEHKKRTKTQRACDSCRSRKIRCDVLPESDPPICQHCKQYGFECTFFLPITETRFKKKRLEEEAAAATGDRHPDGQSRLPTTPKSDSLAKPDTKVLGPTSAAFLLHSTATVPSRAYQNYDQRYHLTWEVSQSGDSFIQVSQPSPTEPASALPKPVDLRIERDVIERLVNSYFNDIAPIFTIVTREEFLSSPSPPPVLLYAICSVAAAARDVPPTTFDNLRTAVSTVIKAEDVLSTASTVNVQALLVLGMCGDCHSQYIPAALSAFWLRVGTAIRMAQDLGLHRAESVKQNLDLRRRLWAACVISDRWCALTYGHPFMIDVEDCDVRLTSSEAVEDLYMNELLKLSILLGRVLKMIYSPSGLVLATDEGLEQLLADIVAWNAALPATLQFQGSESTQHAGLLHLFYACVCMLFWRVFMRISYTVPAHLKFALSIERWSTLVQLSREAIDWLDAHEQLYDVWMLVSYCAVSCALVQYHTWARRQDPEAAATLRKLRDCIRRWEASQEPEHRSTRRKTGEIIALLYESTQSPPAAAQGEKGEKPLNPTVGVRPRGTVPDALRGLVFKKDPTRPGGGVFVAAERPSGDYSDLPKGTIVLKGDKVQVKNAENDGSEAATQQAATNTSAAAAAAISAGSSLLPYVPLANVNPTLRGPVAAKVQVMNVLDAVPTTAPEADVPLEQFAVTDNGLLEGIPGGMFDWDQWGAFFARFSLAGGGAGSGVRAAGPGAVPAASGAGMGVGAAAGSSGSGAGAGTGTGNNVVGNGKTKGEAGAAVGGQESRDA